MKRICSWCKTVMSEGPEPATHGICPECYARVMGLEQITSGNGRFTMVFGKAR